MGIHAVDCIVIRLTAAHDMTSESGLAYALAKVDEAVQADGDILLWSPIQAVLHGRTLIRSMNQHEQRSKSTSTFLTSCGFLS